MESWLIYALIFPAIFAIVNIIDDNFLRKVYRSAYFGAIISGFFGMLPLLLALFYPIQTAEPLIVLSGIVSGFLTVIYYFLYFKGLEVENPSVVVALFNLTPVFALIITFLFLEEYFTIFQLSGFFLILAASTILSLTSFSFKRITFSKGLAPVFIASFIYAIVGILSKSVYEKVDFISGYVYFSLGLGAGALFLSTVFKQGREFYKQFNKKLKKYFLVFLAIELLGISAEMTNNLAISQGPVALVKVVEGIQPVYVLVFAMLFFPFFPRYFREAKEGGKSKKFICMLVIIAGLYLIS